MSYAMKNVYRLFQRRGGAYYSRHNQTGKQKSLKTQDFAEAQRILAAKNQTAQHPVRKKRLMEATASDFLRLFEGGRAVVHANLCGLHNLALSLGGLLQPVLRPRFWRKLQTKPKRRITVEQHARDDGSRRALLACERHGRIAESG